MATIDRSVRPTYRKVGVRAWRIHEGAILLLQLEPDRDVEFPPRKRAYWSLSLYAHHGDRSSSADIRLTDEQALLALAQLRAGFE